MFRYFCDEANIENKKIIIEGTDAKHLKTILRAKENDIISVVTSEKEYDAKIVNIDDDNIKCIIINEKVSNNEADIDIVLCQGIPKQTKMEDIIQQNVEIGVKKFIPIITERTIVKLNDKQKEEKKLERWRKISKESSKQSKRGMIPDVCDIITIKELVNYLNGKNVEIIVPYELEKNQTLKDVLKENKDSYYVIIGPEGGFDEKEIDMLKSIGAKTVTLGRRILRTQTAGIAVCSAIMYQLDQMKR